MTDNSQPIEAVELIQQISEILTEFSAVGEGHHNEQQVVRCAETIHGLQRAALADRDREIDRLKNLVDDWYEHAQNFKAQLADREIDRLRKRTHEIQAKVDVELGPLKSRIAFYENAFARARERVKHVKADWTTDPPSQEEHGFWRYTSINTKDALALLAGDVADRDRAVVEALERLARGKVPGEGDWGDCMMRYAREALGSYEQQRRKDG